MKSTLPGKNTSLVELTNVSAYGFWLLLSDSTPARAEQEVFLPFDKFPWFRSATIAQLTQVERPSPNHLYWPALDIDLAVESIHHPEQFPLVSKQL